MKKIPACSDAEPGFFQDQKIAAFGSSYIWNAFFL